MDDKFFAKMYGSQAKPATVMAQAEKEKRAVKVLGGMKIHSSHLKRVQIGEELIDVPRIEYVQLLEGQIKEARTRLREAEAKIFRLQSNYNKLNNEMRDVTRELATKVNLR